MEGVAVGVVSHMLMGCVTLLEALVVLGMRANPDPGNIFAITNPKRPVASRDAH